MYQILQGFIEIYNILQNFLNFFQNFQIIQKVVGSLHEIREIFGFPLVLTKELEYASIMLWWSEPQKYNVKSSISIKQRHISKKLFFPCSTTVFITWIFGRCLIYICYVYQWAEIKLCPVNQGFPKIKFVSSSLQSSRFLIFFNLKIKFCKNLYFFRIFFEKCRDLVSMGN